MDRRDFLFGRDSDIDRCAESAVAAAPGFSEPPSIEPYEGEWSRSEVYHLLRRTLLAPNHNEVEEAL